VRFDDKKNFFEMTIRRGFDRARSKAGSRRSRN
jgi:hypothetical protein